MKLTKMTTIDGATGAHRIPALLLLLLWFMQFRVQGLWIEWVVLDAARLFVFFSDGFRIGIGLVDAISPVAARRQPETHEIEKERKQRKKRKQRKRKKRGRSYIFIYIYSYNK